MFCRSPFTKCLHNIPSTKSQTKRFFPKLFEDLLLEMKALIGEIFLMGDLNVDIIGSQRNFIDYKILLRLI